MEQIASVIDGTLRALTLLQTIETLKPLLKNVGITRVANITGLDNVGIPVVTAIRPNAKHLATSQGKGLSFEAAWISAVMEAIEAFHAENVKEADLSGSFDLLKQDYPLLDPRQFPKSTFNDPALSTRNLDWIQAKQLASQAICYIPRVLTSLDSTKHMPEYSLFTVNSNGLAAGNTLEEAICHALFELIERDALAHFAKQESDERQAIKIDLTSIDSPHAIKLISQLENAQQEVKLWDVTPNHGIPVYHCTVSDNYLLRGLGIFRGSGCHALKEIALLRAITEAAQSRLTLISGSRDDIFPSYYHTNRKLYQQKSMPPGQLNYQHRHAIDISHAFPDLITWLIAKLNAYGCKDLYLVDHSKAELGVPVVHVFAPALQYEGRRI